MNIDFLTLFIDLFAYYLAFKNCWVGLDAAKSLKMWPLILLVLQLLLLRAAHCQSDELMSSPSTSSIPSETDLFEITGVIILLIVGSCVFVLLWLILFLYFALLCYGSHKKRKFKEKKDQYYREAAAHPVGDMEFHQPMEEFELPGESGGLTRTFSEESEHATTFQRTSSQTRLVEETDRGHGNRDKRKKKEEEEEEEESSDDESSDETGSDEESSDEESDEEEESSEEESEESDDEDDDEDDDDEQ